MNKINEYRIKKFLMKRDFSGTHIKKNCEAMINDSAIAISQQAHAEMG